MFVIVSTCSDHFTLSNFDCLTFLRSNPVRGVGLVMPGRRYEGQTLPKKYRVQLENVSAIILVVIHFCTSGVLWRNGNIVARGHCKPKRYLKQVAKSANESITKFFLFSLTSHSGSTFASPTATDSPWFLCDFPSHVNRTTQFGNISAGLVKILSVSP